MWIDIACIVFVCVTANHLGLVKAIEDITQKEMPIVNCVKCSAFWCTLAYSLWFVGFSDIPLVLAISFLASYSALWLELLEAYIDTLYMMAYEKITKFTTDNKTTTDTDNDSATSTLS